MENNIVSVYIKKETYDLLQKEIKIFHLNNNYSSLIKTIVINFYPSYQEENSNLKNEITKNVPQVSPQNLDTILYTIQKFNTNKTSHDNVNKKHEKSNKKISIRINKNDFEFDSIIFNSKMDVSTFINMLVISYLSKPQQIREKILFKNIINSIEKVISNNKSVEIKYKTSASNKIKRAIITPYKICVSSEELFNYLLYQENKDYKLIARSIHLYNIIDTSAPIQQIEINKEVLNNFEKMKLNGIQFSINENITYKVFLTEEGKNMFNYSYLERPYKLPESNEKAGIYYFNCSELQLFRYFAPFFNNAIILEPLSTRKKLTDTLLETTKNYNE